MQGLIAHGANVDAHNADEWTALHFACHRGDKVAMGILLKTKANRNPFDDWLLTPLHILAMKGYHELMIDLVSHGALYFLRDKNGESPIDILKRRFPEGYIEFVNALIDMGCSLNKLVNRKPYEIPKASSDFIRILIRKGHESVIEHETISVRIVCDRGVSHELVRHRLASYSQESTRYCDYSSDKFQSNISFICPVEIAEDPRKFVVWMDTMLTIEKSYKSLIALGVKPEIARSVLPNSLKTEIVVTMNLREWRHFFILRTSPRAHPQIRAISGALLKEFQALLPPVFEDIKGFEE